VTNLIMPLIYTAISKSTEPFHAWRWAMFVPGFLHIFSGVMILFFTTDLPDGNYALLKKKGKMGKDSAWKVFLTGILNYR
jgi:NNP family nitrate/nitrite transporter-like MFS transporter